MASQPNLDEPGDPSRAAREAAVRLLVSAADVCACPVAPGQAAEAVSQAERAVPGRPEETARARLEHAGLALGLRVVTCRLSVSEMAAHLRRGEPVALAAPSEPGGWLLLLDRDGYRYQVAGPNDSDDDPWIDTAELLRRIGGQSLRDQFQWSLIHRVTNWDPAPPVEEHQAQAGHLATPFERYSRWLRPERRDIQLLLLFALMVGVLSLATPVAVEALVTSVVFTNRLQPLLVLSSILAVCLGFVAMLRAIEALMAEVLQRRLFVRLVNDLAWRLPRIRSDALGHRSGPDLANRFFDVVTLQKVTASLLVDGVDVIVQMLISMLVLGIYHPWLLGFDVVLIVAVAVVIFVLGRGGIASAITESHLKYDLAHWFEQVLSFPLTFRLGGGAELAWRRADRLATQYVVARQTHFRILFRQIVATLILQALAGAVLLSLGGWLVISFELTVGQLVAAELMVSMVIGSFTKLGKHIETWYDLMAAVEKVGLLTDLPTELPHGESVSPSAAPAGVEIEHLRFAHPHGPTVFGQVKLTVAPAGHLAVVIPPGRGKSTLADLLSGRRMPDLGRVLIDGLDTASWDVLALGQRVAVVRSGDVLDDSLAENVRLGRDHVTAGQVRWALDQVGLWEELSDLPGGLNTHVAADGGALTDNQTRRLALARALAGRPRLLVLDGLLDTFDATLRRQVLARLAAPDAEWTLIVLTSHAEIAAEMPRSETWLTPAAGGAGDGHGHGGD